MAEEETPLVSVEEQISTLEGKKVSLEVPSIGDDLEGEALELAQASLDVAQVSYDANIAKIESKIEELKNPAVAPLSEGGNEDGAPDVEDAPLTEGGNEYGEDGPPVEEEE